MVLDAVIALLNRHFLTHFGYTRLFEGSPLDLLVHAVACGAHYLEAFSDRLLLVLRLLGLRPQDLLLHTVVLLGGHQAVVVGVPGGAQIGRVVRHILGLQLFLDRQVPHPCRQFVKHVALIALREADGENLFWLHRLRRP